MTIHSAKQASISPALTALPLWASRQRRLFAAMLLGLGMAWGLGAAAQPTVARANALAPATTAAPTGAPAGAVSVVLTQFKVQKSAKGAEELVDASTISPGDTVEYRAVYKNNSDKAVTGLVADLPIPSGLDYLPKSAKPGGLIATMATNDQKYGAEPLMRKAADGKAEEVPYSEYRAMRWALGPLKAQGTATVSARVKVEVNEVPLPAVVPTATHAPAAAKTSAAAVKPRAAANR